MSTSIPRPGEHLPGTRSAVDPDHVHGAVDRLLAGITDAGAAGDPAETLSRQTQLLEQAHDVLVDALSTVDKI